MISRRKYLVSEVIKRARKDGQVLALILFGSQARSEATAVSDLDLCLILSPAPYTPLELSEKNGISRQILR